MLRESSDGRLLTWAAFLLLWLLATAPLWLVGFPRGHDWLFELVRVAEMGAAFRDGPVPPAWAPDLYGGFGSPIFLFYAPLFGSLSWLLSLVAGSIASGAAAALALVAGIGAAATACLARVSETGGARGSSGTGQRLAIALFLLHPYVVADLALRNACSEYLALMLLPLPLAGAILCRRGSPWGGPLVAAGLGAVILAHNLTALVAAGLLLLLALAGLGRPRSVLPLAAGAGLGLGLTAWFWVPALILLSEVRSGELTEGRFRVVENLPAWGELVAGRYFSVGWLTLLVLGIGLGAFLARGERGTSVPAGILAAAAGALLFLVTPASEAVWRSVGPLALFQFPWRLVGPLALLAAWIAAVALARIAGDWSPRRRRGLEALVLALALVQLWPVLSRVRPLDPGVRRDLPSILDRESILERGLPATVGHEYLPKRAHLEVLQRPRSGPMVVATEAPAVRGTEVDGTTIVLKNEDATAIQVELARWAFPGWRARDDAGNVAPVHGGADGTLWVDLPPGPASVLVEYRSPGPRRWGLGVAALAGLLWIAWCARVAHGNRLTGAAS